jgi:hypothetical protein
MVTRYCASGAAFGVVDVCLPFPAQPACSRTIALGGAITRIVEFSNGNGIGSCDEYVFSTRSPAKK